MSAARQISRSPHQQAFTLVELLVTIAIAILASLLLASLSQARAKADQAACKNNVHQIGVGLQLYTGDFDGHYPPGWSPEYDLYWYRLVENYVGAKWPAINIDRTGIVQRREGSYVCPGYERVRGVYVDPVGVQKGVEPLGAYAYNAEGLAIFDGTDHGGAGGLGRCFRSEGTQMIRIPTAKDSDLVNPADLFAVGDSPVRAPYSDDTPPVPWALYDGVKVPPTAAIGLVMLEYGMISRPFRPDASGEYTAKDLSVITRRHSGWLNVGCADGHVEAGKLESLYKVRAKPNRSKRWATDDQPHSAMVVSWSP